MPRPTREQIDDEILEAAATLFARHGFKETSVQRIADAVGYSKTGLLHRYPTKEALQRAVVERAVQEVRAVGDDVAALPPGAERDRAVITALAHVAVNNPGTIALLLSGLMSAPESEIFHELGEMIFAAFAVDPGCHSARAVRVTGALGALAVAAVALREPSLGSTVPDGTLDDLIEVSYDALGHARPTTH
jgi:AcrR family transcriptional regulator